jgi:hypothetical protein
MKDQPMKQLDTPMSLNCKNRKFMVSNDILSSWLEVLNVSVISSACIQKYPDIEPTWLEGSVSISRSPVAHPGDSKRTVLLIYDMIIDT